MRGILLAGTLATLGVGCAEDAETESFASITKDEARGKADWVVDHCEQQGWYGDGVCDAGLCPLPDPDCPPPSGLTEYRGCRTDADCVPGTGAFCAVRTMEQAEPRQSDGSCVLPTYHPGSRCGDDSHCDYGLGCVEECQAGGFCGRVCRQIPGPCTYSYECGAGRTCVTSCEAGGECASSCVPEGSGCTIDMDCPAGTHCAPVWSSGRVTGQCVAGECESDADCFLADEGKTVCLRLDPDDAAHPYSDGCVEAHSGFCSAESHCRELETCVASDCVPRGCFAAPCPAGESCALVCGLDWDECAPSCVPAGSACNVDGSDCPSGQVCRPRCEGTTCAGRCEPDLPVTE